MTKARVGAAKKATGKATKRPVAKASKKAGAKAAKKPAAKAAKTSARRKTAKTRAATTATKKTAATARKQRAAKAASAPNQPARRAAKKSVPASPSPRVSARQAGKTVADYVAALPVAQQHAAAAIRAILLELAPEASESIKWGQPVYEQGGPFAFLKAAKAHLTFGFWRGTELSDPDGLLQGAGDRMRHMKISGNEVPADAIRAFVGQAILLNAERGDPTRRG
jgi:hypothetical protein